MKKPEYFSAHLLLEEDPATFVARLAATLAPFQYVLESQTEKLVVFNRSTANVLNIAFFGMLGTASRRRSTITLAFSDQNEAGQRVVVVESDNPRVGDLFQHMTRAPQQ
jgi:hypothetical protein